jgi:SDR family mycofactocin-dependent oxidoreductase
MARVDGKVAFITGAARGQGRAHAVRFAEEGADIIAVDACEDVASVKYGMATEADLAETVRLVEAAGRRIVARKADVRSQESLDDALEDGIAELGNVDIVIANAGVFTHAPNSWETTEEEWRANIDIDLSGVWRTCKAAIPSMIEGARGGSIIITASSNGYRAERSHSAYNAAKLGVVGFMRSLAGEVGEYDIRVNTVHPTVVRTAIMWNDTIVDLFKPGESTATVDEQAWWDELSFLHLLPFGSMAPEAISEVMLFLASDAGRYITASEIPVEGGYMRKDTSYDG